MKKIRKMLILGMTLLLGVFTFVSVYADEDNADNSSNKVEEPTRFDPNDYPAINISASNYHNLYPMCFDMGNSAVMVGYFDDIEFVEYSDNLIIDDSGIFSNDYVPFDLSNQIGMSRLQLASAGVVTIGLDFRVMLHEIYDGYQYFYLYDGSTTQLAASSAFDHQYGIHPRIYQFYAEIQLSSLTSDTIYFRFDASGAGDDDWQCDYIDINILVSRGNKAYSGIKYCGEVSTLSSNY